MTTPFNRYQQHAKRIKGKVDRLGNPVEMRLSFEQWYKVWQDSGHWEKRGSRRGMYVMSRYDDLGSYEIGNVFIQLHSDNISDAHKGRVLSKSHRAKISTSHVGLKPSDETRRKLSEAHLGMKYGPEFGAKISARMKGKPKTQSQIDKAKATKIAKGCLQKACTIDGITIYPSRKALWAALGRGKNGGGHPNFHYVTI